MSLPCLFVYFSLATLNSTLPLVITKLFGLVYYNDWTLKDLAPKRGMNQMRNGGGEQ